MTTPLAKTTRVIYFNWQGIPLIAPVTYHMPEDDDFSCCGPGHGIAELAVPESLLGVRITIACHIHDYSWRVAPARKDAFTFYNNIFHVNMIRLVEEKSGNCVARSLRLWLARRYYKAVNSRPGEYIFWELKKKQGLIEENPLSISEDIL